MEHIYIITNRIDLGVRFGPIFTRTMPELLRVFVVKEALVRHAHLMTNFADWFGAGLDQTPGVEEAFFSQDFTERPADLFAEEVAEVGPIVAIFLGEII